MLKKVRWYLVLDVTGMTVRQFEDLIDKPMMSCSSYYVELEGNRIVLSDWLNSYCLTVLVGGATLLRKLFLSFKFYFSLVSTSVFH